MRVITGDDVKHMFGNGPLDPSQINNGLADIVAHKCAHRGIVGSTVSVRYFSKDGTESVTEGTVATMRQGVESRLRGPLPDGTEQVHLVFGTGGSDLVELYRRPEGTYQLEKL